MISKVNRYLKSRNKDIKNMEYHSFPELIQIFQLIIDELEELQKFFLNHMIDSKIDKNMDDKDDTIDLK